MAQDINKTRIIEPNFDIAKAMADAIAPRNDKLSYSDNDANINRYYEIDYALRIVKQIKILAYSNDLLFNIESHRNDATGKVHRRAIGLKLVGCFYEILKTRDIENLDKFFHDREINPIVACFTEELINSGLNWQPPGSIMQDKRMFAEHCNDFICAFRIKVNSTKIKKILQDWEAVTNDRYYGSVDYLNSIFDFGHSRLLCIRLDLGVHQKYQKSMHIFFMRDLFQRFLNNQRCKPSLFKHVVGTIWRLEHTDDKSYYYHCLIIMNGSRVREDNVLCDLIGQYWVKEISNGQGTYWNCNRDPSHYKQLGIGMVDHADLEKRKALVEVVIPYLTCIDEDIRLRITEDAVALCYTGRHLHVRTFGRGQIRKSTRPRISQ